jgi:hypothetical protein
MTKTEEILIEMLTENTGTAICDSGGDPTYDKDGNYKGSLYGYGRNYERNKHRKFEDELPTTLNFETYHRMDGETINIDITVKHNLYHWLKDKLEYNENLDNIFHEKFLAEVDCNNKCWLELIEEFTQWLSIKDSIYEDENEDEKLYYGEQFGFFNEGKPFTVNSYNEENLLEQVIQFHYFTNESGEFVLLQIHGGADVRGGYTKPRVFSVTETETEIFDYARANIYCTGKDHHHTILAIKEQQEKQLILPGMYIKQIDFGSSNEHHWSTDDCYHWYDNGCCGCLYKQLETYEVKDLTEEDNNWEPGKLCVENGVGYCPICGAKLAANF